MTIKNIYILSACLIFIGIGCSSTTPENYTDTSKSESLNTVAKTGAYIRLTSPQEDQVVKSPFLIGGEAQLPDNTVYVRVKNTRGETLISETTTIKEPLGEAGPFSVLVRFAFQSTDSGSVDIYGIDPVTQAEVGLQTVQVGFDRSGSGSADSSI